MFVCFHQISYELNSHCAMFIPAEFLQLRVKCDYYRANSSQRKTFNQLKRRKTIKPEAQQLSSSGEEGEKKLKSSLTLAVKLKRTQGK